MGMSGRASLSHAGEIIAVHLRHADIGDDHVEPSRMVPDQLQGLSPVHRLEHVVAGIAQPARGHAPDDRIVLDHAAATRPCSMAMVPVSAGCSDARPADVIRQIQREGRALPRLALDPNGAAASD